MGVWEDMDADYPTLNQRLRGLPDLLRGAGQKVLEAGDVIATPVNAAMSGIAGGLTGGLLPELLKKAGIKSYARAAEQYPTLENIGQGTGMGLAAVAPGALAARGVQLGARGAGLLPTIGRQAALTGAYTAPATAAEAMRTGDVPQALKRGAIATLIGTGLGTAVDRLLALGQRGLDARQLKPMGVGTSDVKSAMKGFAKRAAGPKAQQKFIDRRIDEVMRQARELGTQHRAWTKEGKRKLLDWISGEWKKIGSLYDKSGVKTADMLDDILAHPAVQQAKRVFDPSDVDDEILKIAQRIDKPNWRWADIREHLGDLMTAGRKAAPDEARRLTGTVAAAIRDSVDNAASALAEGVAGMPDLAQLKRLYPATRIFSEALGKQASRIPGFTGGSDTAARQGLQTAIASPSLSGFTSTALSSAPGQAISRSMAKTANVLSGLGAAGLQRFGSMVPGVAAAGAARQIKDESVAAAEPETPDQAEAADLGAEAAQAVATGDGREYGQRIAEIITQKWHEMGMEQYYPGELPMFMAYARERTDGFAPMKTAQIMYPDEEERKRFLAAYEIATTLSETLPIAQERETRGLGLMDVPQAPWLGTTPRIETPEQLESAAAYQQLANVLGKQAAAAAGAEGKATMERKLEEIMTDRNLSTEGRRRAIEQLLAAYGTDLDLLRQAGVMV